MWKIFESYHFEKEYTLDNISSGDVVQLIDYPAFFDLTEFPLPTDKNKIIERLKTEKIITATDNNLYNITNLGAILFAKNLADFEKLKRKAVRVVINKGRNRTNTIREQIGIKGYVGGFEGFIN